MKYGLAMLLCLCSIVLSAHASEPELRVMARIVPADGVVVGSTVHLEIDVLVDTWLTDAPTLPNFKLDGATVISDSGRAQNINSEFSGKKFFGLRYEYLITPHQAQQFDVPVLNISAKVGQASAPLSAQTSALSFSAKQPTGFAADEVPLVASSLNWQQRISYSAQPLKVGDSITRELRLQAQDALALNLPAIETPDIDGLRAYERSPEVSDLKDSRGVSNGGQRIDRQVYVVEKSGSFTLPSLKLKWWDTSNNKLSEASVEAVEFDAKAATAQSTPFSIEQDLQRLGQRTRIHISQHWLSLLMSLLVIALLVYYSRPLLWRARGAYQAKRAHYVQAWNDSPLYAWRQIKHQLEQPEPQLGAIYLWLKRRTGKHSLRQFAQVLPAALRERLLHFAEQRYGQQPANAEALNDLQHTLPELRKVADQQAVSQKKPALRPLNPR